MDFTAQYHFPVGHHHTYHHLASIPPPLTPSLSQSGVSEEYSSPPNVYNGLAPGDQFHNFGYSAAFQQNPQQNPGYQASHAGPPTPPTNHQSGSVYSHQQQQQHVQSQHQHSHNSHHHHHQPLHDGIGQLSQDMLPLTGTDTDERSHSMGRGSDDDSLTPAQSKRKAQNRAAQRAFRERKEKHLKDVETQLADSRAAQKQSSMEIERLKRDLQKMATENEILKATGPSNYGSASPEALTTGPMRYSPTDFASQVLQGHNNKTLSHRIVEAPDGQRLLAAGASWDFIISHDLFKRGLVDIGIVSDLLKTRAVCDGQGPVFSERDLLDAVESSVASGTDDLL